MLVEHFGAGLFSNDGRIPAGTPTAMVERKRKDFRFGFTTPRFRARSEHRSWQGRPGIVPPMPAPA